MDGLMDVQHGLLSLQLDALSTLVDEQATRRLWKLFTHCAGSIAHGRRLENLSWRCWGRDQSWLHRGTSGYNEQDKLPNEATPAIRETASTGCPGWPQRLQKDTSTESTRPITAAPVTLHNTQVEHRTRSAAAPVLLTTVTTPSFSSAQRQATTAGDRALHSRDVHDDHYENGDNRNGGDGIERDGTVLMRHDGRGTKTILMGSNTSTTLSRTPSSSTSDSTASLDTLRSPASTIATTSTSTAVDPKLAFPHLRSPTLTFDLPSNPRPRPQLPSRSPPLPPSVVSRSPPLGPLIRRVIFTPPRPTDHAAQTLELFVNSVRAREEIGLQDPANQERHLRQPTTGSQPKQQHQRLQPQPATAFPTVVILESTPKPTPPDTPARGQSPSEAQRSIFHHFQTLSPSHALTHPSSSPSSEDSEQAGTTSLNSQPVLDPSLSPSPAPRSREVPRSSPMVPSSEPSSSSNPSAAAVIETSSTNRMAPVPSAPGMHRQRQPHSSSSLESRTSSPNREVDSLLNPSTTSKIAEPPHLQGDRGVGVVGVMAAAPPPTRMFFLQRDSSSLSPDSNSRSGSHSRSPASRSPETSASQTQTRPPPATARNGKVAGRGVDLQTETKTETTAEPTQVRDEHEHHATGPVALAVSRELLEESSGRPSPPPTEHSGMSVPNASSSSSSHTHPGRHHQQPPQQRLVMRSKKGAYRPHLGRSHHERPPSRNSARGSVGSRGSVTTSTAAGGGVNAGSTSASGMGSMSTSAGSKLVMKRHLRTPAHNVPVTDGVATVASNPAPSIEAPPVASGSGHQHQEQELSSNEGLHVSPLAVLPEPLRMEVLERQVVQSAMKGQSAARKISLESDSEEDYTDDEETEDDEEEIVVVKSAQNDAGKSTVVEEEEGGGSWSDEEEEVPAKKRPQPQQQKHSGPAQPPSRRNSRDLDHLVGSSGSGRQSKPPTHLPHVRSKGKVAHHHNHHHHNHHPHHHNAQRGAVPQPSPPAAARKRSAGHTRSAPSQDGPLAHAAREALRQREMFTPLPRERYSSINLVREKSRTSLSRGGRPSNLTMLLNPDPQWFPQNHPYRQDVHPMDQKLSRSMEELYARGNNGNRSPGGVKSPRSGVGLGFGGLKMTTTAQPVQGPAPAPTVTKSPSPEMQAPSKRLTDLSKSPPAPTLPTKLRPSKSAVAVPVVLGVTASSAPRDEKQADTLEMSLRQMGPTQRRQRATRQVQEPVRPEPERRFSDHNDGRESKGTPSSRPSHRLGAKPADIEFSDSEEETPGSPPPNVAGTSGRSLAKEHLEAVMGGKVKVGMSASRTVVASPDTLPKGESDPTSYRPPAPPSSPSVYNNTHGAKPPQGHLPHTPPSSKRPPVARAPRIRPHSSHGQPTAPVASPTTPPLTTATPQRERRQPATSQPPIPVTTAPVKPVVPWPYNLPYPAPVQSPRTTRLNMLASEVPDDLRKDLLWERKTNRIAPLLDNRGPTPLRRNPATTAGLRPMTDITAGGGTEADEESEQARLEREAKERYDKMRTQTWNGVIYQRPVW